MILKLFRRFSIAFCIGVFATAGQAASATDEAVVAAFDAYRAGDAMKFSRLAKKLEGHLLAPWLEYWRLSFGLEDASPDELRAYFTQHGTTYAGERLRTDWMKILGRRAAWQEFDLQSAALPREDLEIRCLRLGSRLAKAEKAADKA